MEPAAPPTKNIEPPSHEPAVDASLHSTRTEAFVKCDSAGTFASTARAGAAFQIKLFSLQQGGSLGKKKNTFQMIWCKLRAERHKVEL